MRIEVHLYATLKKYAPKQEHVLQLDLTDGSFVNDMLDKLQIGKDVEFVLLVNGRPADRDRLLHDGDRVVMFPPVAGG